MKRVLLSETQNLLFETHDDKESGNEYDDDSTLPPLLSEEEMDTMSSFDESDAEPMSTELLEDILDGSQSYPSINRVGALYKIHDHIKQRQAEWKLVLLSTINVGRGLYKVFKAVVKELSEAFPILGESGSEVTYFFPKPTNFAELTRLSEGINKPWLKANMKDINNLFNNRTF